MNDLSIQRNELRNPETSNPVMLSKDSLAARDLSFRKIQAAAESTLARLKNHGFLQEVTLVQGDVRSHVFSRFTDPSAPYLFFGNVHARLPTNNQVTIQAETLRLVTSPDPDLPLLVERTYHSTEVPTDAPGVGINVVIKNALIGRVNAPSNDYAHRAHEVDIFYYGLLIQLKKPMGSNEANDIKNPYILPYSVTTAGTAAALSSGNFNSSNALNFWDASSAATGIPAYLNPVKRGHMSANLLPIFTGTAPTAYPAAEYIMTPIRESEEDKLMVPSNFLGFLQHLYSRIEGNGAQYQVPPQPSMSQPSRTPLQKMISEIVYAVRAGTLVLGNNPTRFRLMAYDFNQPDVNRPLLDGTIPISLSTHFFGVDPLEAQGVVITRVATVMKYVGSAPKVVSLFYPHCAAPAAEFVTSIAYDLLQVDIKEILISLPPHYGNTTIEDPVTKEEAPATNFHPEKGLRSRSQYASSFKYPSPLT